ncbi:hypothetical protein [Streptomyces lydicus]|uniref:hypothetical protein n=1 Tax=Streptomyces lydicus TaxID=47763 RepID=UPI003788CE0A
MGEITLEMRRIYGRDADLIPADVLARIGRDEILDRLDEAQALRAKVKTAPSDLAYGYVERAQQILKAAPRDEVEEAAGHWLQKAQDAYTPTHSAECRRQAALLRTANPAATRRRREPSREEKRHAEALAAFKADVVTALASDPDWVRMQAVRTAQADQLQAGVAELAANVADIRKAMQPDLTKIDGVSTRR